MLNYQRVYVPRSSFLRFIFYVFVDPSTMTGMAKWAFGKFPMKINLAE